MASGATRSRGCYMRSVTPARSDHARSAAAGAARLEWHRAVVLACDGAACRAEVDRVPVIDLIGVEPSYIIGRRADATRDSSQQLAHMRAKHVAAAPGFGRPSSVLLASRCRRRRVAAPLPSARRELHATRLRAGRRLGRADRACSRSIGKEGAAGSELCARDASVMSSSFVGRHDARPRAIQRAARCHPQQPHQTPSPSTRSVTSRLLPTPRAALDGDPRRGAFRVVVTRRRGAAHLGVLAGCHHRRHRRHRHHHSCSSCVPSCGSSSSITARWLGAGRASSDRGWAAALAAARATGAVKICASRAEAAPLGRRRGDGRQGGRTALQLLGGRSLDWTNGCYRCVASDIHVVDAARSTVSPPQLRSGPQPDAHHLAMGVLASPAQLCVDIRR